MTPGKYCTLFTILINCSLISCTSIKPVKPVENYSNVARKPETSIINIYADLEISKLEKLINSKLDSVLYNDTSFVDNNGDDLKLKAVKNGDVKLTADKNVLGWELPLKVVINKGLKILGFKVPLVDTWEYSGQVRLKFKTTLSLNHDWGIKTNTISDGYTWTKKPAVKIAGIDIPVTIIANLMLPANLRSYSGEIDKIIVNSIDYRGLAGKGWQMLFEPFKIPGEYNAWLSITPYSVAVVPVEGGQGHMRLGAAITSDVECLLDKVPPKGKVTSLPDLQIIKSAADTFKVNLLADIPYTSINKMLSDQITDSVFTFGSRHIRFETFRVYGNNEKIAVETKISGSLNGILYLTGLPYFNPADTTLRIKNLKFDIKTQSLLIKSASWLFNSRIEKTMEKSIAVPFRDNVSEVEKQMTYFLKHYPLGFGFELIGKLKKLTVSDLYLTPESVKANIVFSGNLSLILSDDGASPSH